MCHTRNNLSGYNVDNIYLLRTSVYHILTFMHIGEVFGIVFCSLSGHLHLSNNSRISSWLAGILLLLTVFTC